ncbi:MAG TPA: Ig-like domain-containing protein [Fimbriimonas sp.]|nr:Ig-like domain-containing protein [Fimbriimonas sp.]
MEVFGRGTGVSSGATTTLSPLPSDLFIGQKVTLTATLRDKASHDGIAGEEVMFMVDSQVVGTATTNAYGVAKLAWIVPESLTLGSHTLFASFAGDLDHARGDSEKFVTAQPGPVILSMPDKSGTVGNNVTLVATLKNAANQPLPGRTIEFRFDGALVGTGTTDGTGKATYTYSISVGAGPHEITAHFAGETKHPEQTVTGTLTVNS